MSGLQLLDNIKSQSLPTPVILMTGFGTCAKCGGGHKKRGFRLYPETLLPGDSGAGNRECSSAQFNFPRTQTMMTHPPEPLSIPSSLKIRE